MLGWGDWPVPNMQQNLDLNILPVVPVNQDLNALPIAADDPMEMIVNPALGWE